MSRLEEKIKEYKEAFVQKAPKEIANIMLDATKKLKETNISANSLKVGDRVELFTLPNVIGKSVSLEKLLNDNDFVVISFYRGGWCPYCNLELNALQAIVSELESLNTSLIAVSPQTPDASLSTKEKSNLTFEVLSDEKNIVAQKFGLIFCLAKELQGIYESFGIDIPSSNDDFSYEIPMPGTYVVDKNATIIYSFIDEDYTKRSEPQEILDTIRSNI